MIRYNTVTTRMFISLRDEVDYVENYVNLQRCRYGDSVIFRTHISSILLEIQVLRFLLQPIVENSIMHGFLGKKSHGSLRIRGLQKKDKMVITITDNGCGIPSEELRRIMAGERRKSYHGGGFGLRNIDERIKLAFGESYGLRVRSKYGIGTQVSIFLPLDERGELP